MYEDQFEICKQNDGAVLQIANVTVVIVILLLHIVLNQIL